MIQNNFAVGIDIGGTNSVVGLCDNMGNISSSQSFPTNNFDHPEDFVKTASEWIESKKAEYNIVGVGIGAPNGNITSGTIEFAPNLPWEGQIRLAEMFQKATGLRTILTNDANAAAIGEMTFGNAKNLTDFVLITLGTGLGSGVVIHNELVSGAHGIAGEFGHIIAERNGRECGCGRKGCLETYVSSTGIVRSVFELNSEHKLSSALLKSEAIDARVVFEQAEKGDRFANEVIGYTAEMLGRSLADFACFSDPQAFVLFGGIAQSGQKFADLVKSTLEDHILNIYANRIEIRVSSLHDKNAAILGAASLILS